MQTLFNSFVSNKDKNIEIDEERRKEREKKALEPVSENLDYDPEGLRDVVDEEKDEDEDKDEEIEIPVKVKEHPLKSKKVSRFEQARAEKDNMPIRKASVREEEDGEDEGGEREGENKDKKIRDRQKLEVREREIREREDKRRKESVRKANDESKVNPSIQLDKLVNTFWNNDPFVRSQIYHELEIRFGTRGIKPITKIDYDNVICKLKSFGFTTTNASGEYMLRIQNEFLDPVSGNYKKPNNNTIRTEIDSFSSIQEYCKTNDIEKLLEKQHKSITFNKKMAYSVKDSEGKLEYSKPVNFDDWNFRASYQTEETLKLSNNIVRSTIAKWTSSKKMFRYINRVTFTHPNIPIKVDLSIVKSSKMNRGEYILTNTLEESGLFHNVESYEIELEVSNKHIGPTSEVKEPSALLVLIRKTIKYILMGLQGTNYPVSYAEQNEVLRNYMRIVEGRKDEGGGWGERGGEREGGRDPIRVYSKNFIGPSSCTLQIANIVPVNENCNIPNIRNNYTVTDKADGDRALMIISNKGKIYLLNSSMKIIFTGAKTENKELFNSILDGELIYHNKYGQFINLYAAFDIYFVKNEDVRSHAFFKNIEINLLEEEQTEKRRETGKEQQERKEDKGKPEILRLQLLKSFVKALNVKSILEDESISPIRVMSKQFYIPSSRDDIFSKCGDIIDKDQNGLLEYKIDGLIFTPANMGVGIDSIGKPCPNKKVTWEYSFKWKPSIYNTIDFLVTTKKTSTGTDIVTPIFQDGQNVDSTVQLNEFKTIVLRVGYDSKTDGYLNPCQDVIDNIIPKSSNLTEDSTGQDYYPVQFYPTEPYDELAGITNIMLRKDESGISQMIIEDGSEVFQDNTIVEFKYSFRKEVGWRWIPIKVRYDKTADLRNGAKNFGNAYRVANNNWKSIHNPITEEMIAYGQGIPDELEDDNIYYNKVTSSKTAALRDFHNLYVKKLLINSVSKPSDILIDYAVGKAGDLPKWISAKLGFVFGIDLSKDCLENKKDGACARYLNYRKSFKKMPAALFVNGNSAHNIKSGEAMLNDKAKQITSAIFGRGSKDEKKLGAGVFAQFGKAADGFEISSCQFALHYFFENETTLQKFMINLAECTKLNGYFIGTCYDGNLLFQKLMTKECINMYDTNDTKICEIKKNYDNTEFEPNISSLGYEIYVYQESIGKMYVEYLVNFAYLNRVMENYGFRLLTMEEAHAIGLPNSSGSFSDLYNTMIEEIKIDKYKQNDYGDAVKMSAYEKTISFLNKYVVYKKISKIDNIEAITLELLEDTVLEHGSYIPQKKTTKKAQMPVKKRIDLKLPKVVNLHKKIRLLEDIEIEIEGEKEVEVVEEEVNVPNIKEGVVDKEGAVDKGKEDEEEEEEIEIAVKEKEKEKKVRKTRTKKALKIATEEIAPPIAEPIVDINLPIKKPVKPRTKKVKEIEAEKVDKEVVKEVEKEIIKPVKVKTIKEKVVKEKTEKPVKEKIVKDKKTKKDNENENV